MMPQLKVNPRRKTQVLIIDDEEDIRDLLRYNLEQENLEVHAFAEAEPALQHLEEHSADLILLDLMLPGIGGLEVCKRLKRSEKSSRIPIIMITARSTETDVIVGLELGADDYVTKPFSPREVVARVRSILRRIEGSKRPAPTSALKFQGLDLDLSRVECKVDGKLIKLTPTEFKLLECLMRRPGHVFRRDELIDYALGEDVTVIDRTVDVHITNLRKKLGSYGGAVESIRSAGYRLKDTFQPDA